MKRALESNVVQSCVPGGSIFRSEQLRVLLICFVWFHHIVLSDVSHTDGKVYLTPANAGTGKYVWPTYYLTQRRGMILVSVLIRI